MFELGSIGGNKLDAAAALRLRPQVTVKNHMLRLLRRSHSTSNTPIEKMSIHRRTVPNNGAQAQKYQQQNGQPHPHARVVNVVEGLPSFVLGKQQKKIKVNSCDVILKSMHPLFMSL